MNRLARILGKNVLRPLGELQPFDFWTPAIAEPEGVADHGIYVDHIYF